MYQETEITYKELIQKLKNADTPLVIIGKKKMWVPKKLFNALASAKHQPHIDNDFAVSYNTSHYAIISYDPDASEQTLIEGLFRDFHVEDIMTQPVELPDFESR